MVRIRDHMQISHIRTDHPSWTDLLLGQLTRMMSTPAEHGWLLR